LDGEYTRTPRGRFNRFYKTEAEAEAAATVERDALTR